MTPEIPVDNNLRDLHDLCRVGVESVQVCIVDMKSVVRLNCPKSDKVDRLENIYRVCTARTNEFSRLAEATPYLHDIITQLTELVDAALDSVTLEIENMESPPEVRRAPSRVFERRSAVELPCVSEDDIPALVSVFERQSAAKLPCDTFKLPAVKPLTGGDNASGYELFFRKARVTGLAWW